MLTRSAWIGTAFAQDDADAARKQWRNVADQLRPRVPKLAALMDEAEADVLAFMAFPKEQRITIHSTNPLERLNGEIKRRTDVVRIFPNQAAIVRLVAAILLEQNDEWAVQRRYMSLETLGTSAGRGSLIAQPNAAREHRSYTTRWDTIVLSPDDLPAGRQILPGRTPAT